MSRVKGQHENPEQDRDDLVALISKAYTAAIYARRSSTAYQDVADAIITAGWVHWPHDCDTEAELIAQWAHTSFDNMQELHRLTSENTTLRAAAAALRGQRARCDAENTSLRRRLVEAGALDPSESVGE